MTILKPDQEFCNMVDELVGLSYNDIELSKGIAWIDEQGKKLGISFYEMFFIVLQRHLADEKAKEWLGGKNTKTI